MFLFGIGIVVIIVACAHGQSDGHFVLDPPAHTLRGHNPNGADDRPESDCDPVKKPDGSVEYQCVGFFFDRYQALLDERDRLRTELKACQSTH